MARITLGGNPCNTNSEIPAKGSKAPAFNLVKVDMGNMSLADMKGKRVILNIYPSVDTGVCAASTRKFNTEASSLKNTIVACVSRDLPFAQKRFCGAEGLEHVVMLSDFITGDFSRDYGVLIIDGGFKGLCARVVVVLDEEGTVLHSQLVPEVGQEPDYDAALAVLK